MGCGCKKKINVNKPSVKKTTVREKPKIKK